MSSKRAIRQLTQRGRVAFTEALALDEGSRADELARILAIDELSTATGLEFSFSHWSRRFELATDLYMALGPGTPHRRLASNVDFWNGLAAAYMLWLLEERTSFKTGESARWVLNMASTRRHRHLLFGPFETYEANYPEVENAMAGLATDPLVPGEVVERVCGKAGLLRGTPMELATLLFYDKETGSLKRGSGDHGPGGVRRLSYFLSALDLTVDYPKMNAAELAKILPPEFDRWKSAS